MKEILIIQHEMSTPPGTTLDWAQERGVKTSFWFPATESTPPNSANFHGIVICGGSMDTFQEDQYPWLKEEKEFLRQCIQKGMKIFGLCLGSQLLAEILGGRVYQNTGWEIGFIPIQNGHGQILHAFHWHHCTFDLPPTARRTWMGNFCLNQAFEIDRNIVATQFHPESTREWILECTQELEPRHTGNVQGKEQIESSLDLQKQLQDWYFQELDRLFLT